MRDTWEVSWGDGTYKSGACSGLVYHMLSFWAWQPAQSHTGDLELCGSGKVFPKVSP